MQWFFCVWRGPNGNKQCALQQNQESNPQNICEDDDGGNRITLKGSRTNCDIELKDVQVSDFGTWQCIVTDDVNFQTDKTKIALEVGQAANVKFSQNFGKDSTLIITEGDSVSVSVLFKVISSHKTSLANVNNCKNDTEKKYVYFLNKGQPGAKDLCYQI